MTAKEFSAARKKLGWRGWEMAERLGVTGGFSRIGDWEHGRLVIPRYISAHLRIILSLAPDDELRKRWNLVRRRTGEIMGTEEARALRKRVLRKLGLPEIYGSLIHDTVLMPGALKKLRRKG